MRNNRHRKFAERHYEFHRPAKKTESSTPMSVQASSKDLPPWEGNPSRFKTPHMRHPDLTAAASVIKTGPLQQIKKFRVLKQSVGLGLSTGDRVMVWSDPDTGRISTLPGHPPHYVQREVIVIASFYEYPPSSKDDQWIGGEWSPIVYIPFPSEGAARLSVAEFNGTMGVAGEPISGIISHVDSELLDLLKTKESDPRFRILWSKMAFKFVAATKPPLLSRQANSPSWRALEKSRRNSYVDTEPSEDTQVQNQYSATPIEIDEDDFGSSSSEIEDDTDPDQASEEPYTISKVKPVPLKLSPNSLVYHIFSMLTRHRRPLHIDEMIDKLEEKNLLQNYGHHKYSSIYSAISKHYELFDKSAKATFSIREAFKHKSSQKQKTKTSIIPKIIKQESKVQVKTLNKTVKSLPQMVLDVAKEIGSTSGVYPGAVYQFLMAMGYSVSYSSVYRIMQNKKNFSRKGFCYHHQQGSIQ